MKLLLGTVILGATASVFAQEAPTAARVALQPTLATDVILAGVAKNAPFTADESGETVKIMPDGNRVVQSWTGKIARSSEGRIRRDITSGNVDGGARPMIFGGAIDRAGVIAVGTGEGTRHVMLSKVEAEYTASHAPHARQAEGSGVSVIASTGNLEEAKRVIYLRAEAAAAAEGADRVRNDAEAVRVALPRLLETGKFESRKESLGTRDFGGVQADGVRVITTIAAGAVGNDQEIEITLETWYSKELGVVVYSKRNDPRVGETTYQMTNINRVEPDASFFPTRQ